MKVSALWGFIQLGYDPTSCDYTKDDITAHNKKKKNTT